MNVLNVHRLDLLELRDIFSNPTLLNHHFDEAPKRIKAGRLCCGVLDWGGFGATCLGHKLWWYFNCSEFELLKERAPPNDWLVTCSHCFFRPADDRQICTGELSGVFADFRGLVRWGVLEKCRRSVGFWFEIKQWVWSLGLLVGFPFSMVCLFGSFESGYFRPFDSSQVTFD